MKNQFFIQIVSKLKTKRSQLNSDNHENSLITAIMAIFMTGLVCSPLYVFATKPDPGFINSSNCKIFPLGAKPANKTCCWKESDGLVFSQTCTYTSGEGYTTCDDKELQLFEVPSTPPNTSSFIVIWSRSTDTR